MAGVIGTPTLRQDGSLLNEEGYDERTGLVLLAPPLMPPIPDHPTKKDAQTALSLLLDLLVEFPFINDVSRSVGVSMLMTPVLRGGLFPAVPMHTADAPDAGTGKSYLADIASAIATGDRCYVQSAAPGDPKETEKRLISAALGGHPIIAIDNCNAGEGLSGDFLCQLTERPGLLIRRMGGNDMERVQNNYTVISNGNNISLFADMVRRTLMAQLDANMEAPEDRAFAGNPVATVRADRGRYVAACITIARAYIMAGRPGRLNPLPSYEGWSDTVRSALVWLDLPDPVLSQAALRVDDPVRQETTALFDAWASELGFTPHGFLTAEIIKAADARYPDGDWQRPRLREALLDVASDRAKEDQSISARRLGKWLRNATNKVRHGLKLTCNATDAARPRWVLIRN
jgi:putative DNA primase/helicase